MNPAVTAAEPAPQELVEAPPSPRLIDSHAHLHFDIYRGEVDAVLHRAREAGVNRIITVGVTTADSLKAVELAATYQDVWATVGIHPHDAGEAEQGLGYLRDLAKRRKVVAIGECGLDFYKSTTTPVQQETALRAQIELAQELELPLVFHVREAFDHFFKIIADYSELRGVVHSFTGTPVQMERVIESGLMVALNGITTFTKDSQQLEAARQVPASSLILETDCPFLSPAPYRGQTNEPARISDIAAFLAELRGESVAVLAAQTTTNSERLFKLP